MGTLNALIVTASRHEDLIAAFNRYVNVFAYVVDWTKFGHLVHLLPGKLKSEHPITPNWALGPMARVLNRRRAHLFLPPEVSAEDIDLVFVSDPVTCRIDLRPFKNAVKAYWSHDSIYPKTYFTQLTGTRIQDYDVIFSPHKFLNRFKELGLKTMYLPYALNPDIYKRINTPIEYDAAFVGTLTPNRAATMKMLSDKFPQLKIFCGKAWQHEAALTYNKSRVVLNLSQMHELNWRIFEVLGCNRLLLTDRNDEVSDLFDDGKHLVMYDDQESLISKVIEYSQKPEVCDTIASQGYNEVIEKHTLDRRVEEVLNGVGFGEFKNRLT